MTTEIEAGLAFSNEDDGDDRGLSATPESIPPSHICNREKIHVLIRFGLPMYLVGTFGLLLASDLGSGVSADQQYTSYLGKVELYDTILTVSIFSSVSELWKAGSYALAIFIVITSICWPYIKLALTLLVWILPFRKGPKSLRRRERLVEWLDALGKWSFVDIKVFIIVMVAFRMNIEVPAGYIDIFIVPKWGFFGFVVASMLSLAGTHYTLYLHRLVMYGRDKNGGQPRDEGAEGPKCNENERTGLIKKTKRHSWVVGLLLFCTFVLILVGSLLDIFTYTYTQGGNAKPDKSYSLVTIGTAIREASPTPDEFGMYFVQIFFFVLVIATPLYNIFLFSLLYFWPLSIDTQKKLFFLTEITFAWGALEVFFISAIFSIQQIPKFGTGIVSSGCDTCYVVGAKLLPQFAVLGVASVLNFGLTLWLFWGAHGTLYKHSGPKGCWI